MSAPEPIRVELTAFQKLQILRDQLEDRQRELESVESKIRDNLAIIEEQRYLESLSPYYAANPLENMPSSEDIKTLEQKRAALFDLVKNIEATLPAVMELAEGKGGGGQSGPSLAAGPARKARFDSFDDFIANR
ncbi:MAG: hypothetical protein JXR97_17170 [Planctomycetes bacterium]|nr:hypothetical protein [Planctomycetota bacterium]